MTTHLQQFSRGALLAASLGVVLAALTPGLAPPGAGRADLWTHVAAFALLGGLGRLAFPGRAGGVASLVLLLALGGLIEGLQAYLPGRAASLADLLADGVGLALGYLTVALALHSARWRHAR